MSKWFYTVLIFIISTSALAQRASYFKRVFVDAEYYLLYEDYKEALPLYRELLSAFPNNANIAYRIGVCYLNIPNEKEKSIPFFEQALKNVTNDYNEGYFTENKAPREVYLNYGIALRIVNDFEKAIEVLKKYKGLLQDNETFEKELVNHELSSIEYAKTLMQNSIEVEFKSVGRAVNTRFPEINPVVSSDNNTLVYTSTQQFYNAILMSNRRANVWSHPINLNSQMFADGEIQTVGITPDGKTLLLARNDNDIFNLYTSSYDTAKNAWGIISRLPKEINTRSWENYGSFSPTGDTLYFSSNRPYGKGGFDIYMSIKTVNGWTDAIILNDQVNSRFDEIAPNVSQDGKKLYFSSKGHKTMGGYDLFVSHKVNGKWSEPINLGHPLNTTDDDVFFFPIGDGSSGYISRLMPESFGENDIYLVIFNGNNRNENDPNNSNTITLDKLGLKPKSSVNPNYLSNPKP